MIDIYIFGQRHAVPEGLTILRAFEWAGFHLTRGVGCRGGFCGACSTVFRRAGDHQLRYALACQTVVEAGMNLGPIPFFPAQRPAYHLEALKPEGATLLDHYPEILRCLGCNTCSKACPQELDVIGYVAAAIRGDLPALAEASFDCILCGLCTARCPAELAPPNVALLGRRLYGKYLAPPAAHVHERAEAIERGEYRAEVSALKALPLAELKARYNARDIEA